MTAQSQDDLIAEIRRLRRRLAELEDAQGEHKRTEEALRDSESRGHAYLESASEGIVIADQRGRMIETAPAPGQPGWVCLRVTDTGPGIPDETLPRIFDPFYTTKVSGTGLGLSVSHGIIQDHNGTVDVQSVPGKGTTFILTFPALEPRSP